MAEQLRGVEFVVDSNPFPTLVTTEDVSKEATPIIVEYQDMRQPPNPHVYACLAWDALDERREVPAVLSMLLASAKMIEQGCGFGTLCQISCWCGPSNKSRPKLFAESVSAAFDQARQSLYSSGQLESELYESATRSADPKLVDKVVDEIREHLESSEQTSDGPVVWYALDWDFSSPNDEGEMQITFFLQPVAAHAMLATNETGERRLPVTA